MLEKNALMPPARGEEEEPFCNRPEQAAALNKACPQGKLVNLSLTSCGIIPVKLTWGKGTTAGPLYPEMSNTWVWRLFCTLAFSNPQGLPETDPPTHTPHTLCLLLASCL